VTNDLATRTLQLVDIPSESRSEAALVDLVRDLVPGPAHYDDGEVLLYGDGPVVLAGHLDTIPAQGNIPGRIADEAVHGVGASDMKGGVAVMRRCARALPLLHARGDPRRRQPAAGTLCHRPRR
jgi:succinyl-diaminopimelate desuccinylase